ncbi:MAG: class I SAM-dependent methyltransferase [Cyanobacteria bacterium J06638_7]
MKLAKVVFYGRPGRDGLAMFALDPGRWRGARVLDCPGGPGSLSALLRGEGLDVTAVDPLYSLAEEDLRHQALADLDHTLAKLARDPSIRADFDLEACRRRHQDSLARFLEDRRQHPHRYIAAGLPELPFADGSFDLVLSGHLLFSYAPLPDGGLMAGDGLGLDWHRRALLELLRLSRQAVRLYPAHTMERPVRRHPYAAALLAELPPGWSGRFACSDYDQGLEGPTDRLELQRSAGPAPCRSAHGG